MYDVFLTTCDNRIKAMNIFTDAFSLAKHFYKFCKVLWFGLNMTNKNENKGGGCLFKYTLG